MNNNDQAQKRDYEQMYYRYESFSVVKSKFEQGIILSGFILPNIVSPRAYIAKQVTLGQGNIVMHDALVNINMDKKDLALIYKEHNLLSTLFPITRSCVTETMNFDAHCGECWWCKERIWAFGKL